jgi:hypothetical protein
MALEVLTDGLWTATAPMTFFGLRVGTRMTVVRLADGGLLVHSAIAASPALRAAVDALGTVRHVVAPNTYHHTFAGQWQAAYPEAIFHAPDALRKKRPDLRIDRPLGDAPHPDWEGTLVPVTIDGCMLHETVFVHAPSRTLVSSDLTENFETSDHWYTRNYLKLAGLHGRIGWSRLLRVVYRDRRAARRSVDALLEHDFDRIVIAHGRIIERDGKDAVRQTFEFLGGRR